MKINVKGIFDYSEQNLEKNKVLEDYDSIIKLSLYEKNKAYGNFLVLADYNFSLRRALELLDKYRNYNRAKDNKNNESKDNLNSIVDLSSNIHKQIFINSFVFDDNYSFARILLYNNISIEKIEKLIREIDKKKTASKLIKLRNATSKDKKVVENPYLELSNIINVEGVMNSYGNFSYPEIIVNKILELYFINNDIINEVINDEKEKKVLLKQNYIARL